VTKPEFSRKLFTVKLYVLGQKLNKYSEQKFLLKE
jgi:hypothetical protein